MSPQQRVGKGTWHLFQRLSLNTSSFGKENLQRPLFYKGPFFLQNSLLCRDREVGYPGPGGKGSLLDQTLLGLLLTLSSARP